VSVQPAYVVMSPLHAFYWNAKDDFVLNSTISGPSVGNRFAAKKPRFGEFTLQFARKTSSQKIQL
jgi:hypothetical protein